MNKNRNYFLSDAEFDSLFNDEIRALSYVHWTPIEVAYKALDWLDVKSTDKVLDIGSGVGKFCIIAGHASRAQFTGVELRKSFIEVASDMAKKLGIENVSFINADINTINFKDYDAFYYYNPFCEMLSEKVLIDNQITYSRESHRAYEDYVYDQLQQLPKGTKIVTYCSPQFIMPPDYDLSELYFEGTLSLWVRSR